MDRQAAFLGYPSGDWGTSKSEGYVIPQLGSRAGCACKEDHCIALHRDQLALPENLVQWKLKPCSTHPSICI